MKMKLPCFLRVSVFSLAVLFYGCKNTGKINAEMPDVPPDSISNIVYAFPSPDEIFEYIQLNEITYIPGLVNPPEYYHKYNLTSQQLINIGIYVADLAYLSTFTRTNEIPEYLNAIKNLTISANIPDIYPEKEIEKAMSKNYHPDSLMRFAQEVYSGGIAYLIDNEMNQALAYISLGAFIESMYLATHYVNLNNYDEDLVSRIIEQKFTYENISQFLHANLIESDNSSIETSKQLAGCFSLVSEKETGNVKSDNSAFMPSKELVISKDNFLRFKEQIKNIRTSVVQ